MKTFRNALNEEKLEGVIDLMGKKFSGYKIETKEFSSANYDKGTIEIDEDTVSYVVGKRTAIVIDIKHISKTIDNSDSLKIITRNNTTFEFNVE